MYPMLGTVLTKAQKSISSLALAEETHRPSKAATTMRMAAYRVDKPTLRQSRIAGSDLDHADTSSSTCVAGEWRPRASVLLYLMAAPRKRWIVGGLTPPTAQAHTAPVPSSSSP